VLDGDAHLLAGEESGVFDPSAGELDPGIKLGRFKHVRRFARGLIAKRLLNLDGAFRKRSGLYYYKARMYSPTLGRFLQTDPIGTTDDLNLYVYVKNNPVNFTDPTGLLAKTQTGSNFTINTAAAPATAPKLDGVVFTMPKSEMGIAIQVAGVVTDPSHYIKRVGAGNIDSVVNVAVGITQSPGFVGGTSFGMTVNGVNYNVRSFVLPMGDINLGTIHPDDGRHK
jgi:RHS repeat-associated protein